MIKILQNKKNWISFIIVVLLVGLCLGWFRFFSAQQETYGQQGLGAAYNATISQIISDTESDTGGRQVHLEVYILNGPYQDTTQAINQVIALEEMLTLYPLDEGDNVIVTQPLSGNAYAFAVVGFQRSNQMSITIIALLVLLVFSGGIKGMRTVLTLAGIALVVFTVFVPGMLAHANIYYLVMGSSLLIAALVLIFRSGLTLKTVASLIGVGCGVAITSAVAMTALSFLHIHGPDDTQYALLAVSAGTSFSAEAVLFAAVVMGSLGAMIDISVTTVQALETLKIQQPSSPFRKLFWSGMGHGFDALSTTATTLVMAYLGTGLPTLLLLYWNDTSATYRTNSQWLSIQVMQLIVGASAIVWVIPIAIGAYAVIRSVTGRLSNSGGGTKEMPSVISE